MSTKKAKSDFEFALEVALPSGETDRLFAHESALQQRIAEKDAWIQVAVDEHKKIDGQIREVIPDASGYMLSDWIRKLVDRITALEAFKAKVMSSKRMSIGAQVAHKMGLECPGEHIEVYAVPVAEVEAFDHIVDANKMVEQQKERNKPAIALLNEWSKEPPCNDPDCEVCKMLNQIS